MRRVPGGLSMLLLLWGTASAQAQHEAEIAAYDGFSLGALYYAAEAPGPGILLLHQCDRRGPATGFEGLAAELRRRGFHVLVLDYRTYGQSVGDAFPAGAWQRAGPHMEKDVAAAYQYLVGQPGVRADIIGLAGASCGGRHAVTLAAQQEEVKTLVFLSSLVGGAVFPKYQSLVHLPVLCITSEDDPNGRTTASMEEVCEASEHADSALLTYEGAAHGTPLLEQDPALVIRIAEWFEAHLER